MFVSITFVMIIIGAFYNIASHKVLKINGEYWYTTIADEREEWAKGLGQAEPICDSCGMLFDFKDNIDRERVFWMKDMRYNLDIYWLDKDYNVLHVEKNLSPDTYFNNNPPLTYGQGINARYVFEVKAQ